MSKLIIPIILVFTIVVAGAFAFAPIENASTVHTIVMANTVRVFELTPSTTTAGLNLVITCPSTSDGCRILELYIEEEVDDGDGATVVLGALNALINSETFVIQANLGTTISDSRQAIAGVSGTTFGQDDTLTLVNTGSSTNYRAIIFIEVEGNTIPTAAFQ